ncbi:hypothetical protein PoB_000852300 [Plakobranchus ocellatus]|uniref:Uncharacterized protein n=1 Tax=Plakobranchus ocellatus TaxID=259542 RepID=A0AAV3YHX6_9GAST|nr:hypothetical protein PoB_000852300 [Plakobranchus ocellatus]
MRDIADQCRLAVSEHSRRVGFAYEPSDSIHALNITSEGIRDGISRQNADGGYAFKMSPQQSDLGLSGPPSGHGASGGARTRYTWDPRRSQGGLANHYATNAHNKT